MPVSTQGSVCMPVSTQDSVCMPVSTQASVCMPVSHRVAILPLPSRLAGGSPECGCLLRHCRMKVSEVAPRQEEGPGKRRGVVLLLSRNQQAPTRDTQVKPLGGSYAKWDNICGICNRLCHVQLLHVPPLWYVELAVFTLHCVAKGIIMGANAPLLQGLFLHFLHAVLHM